MAFHGLRHPTLTGAEPGQLLVSRKQDSMSQRLRFRWSNTFPCRWSSLLALKDRWRGGSIAPFDKERALRGGVDFVGALEELNSRHLWHPQIGDDQRNLPTFGLNAVEVFESLVAERCDTT